ncbi:MAG TPA: hypothetical protein VHR46_10535 [Gaiella sp.]|nr:hypothetical protein [Gaiella sp.]
MTAGIVTIDRRYRGPLDSANGGYAAGILGSLLGASAEVTLRLPPPLERPLAVRRDGQRVLLEDDGRLVAEAAPGDPGVEPPVPPGHDEAAAAAVGVGAWGPPAFAECFVCGVREDDSGLGIHAGPVPGRDGLVAAAWEAHGVTPEVVWAAIDCAGAYAAGDPGRGEVVLGRMTTRIERLPEEDEPCVVVGWPLGEDGRKLFAGTALFGRTGDLLAVARQVWIAPR